MARRRAEVAPSTPPTPARRTLRLEGPLLRVAVVADTHGRPHPKLESRLEEIAPQHILHAGDVGDPAVLQMLERHAPVTAVRGNIDDRFLPAFVALEVQKGEATLVTILLTHIAVNGPRLRSDVARLARAEGASLVVCGHSHVPFAAVDGGLTVFNPGSVGPRRFQLPIVLGVIEVSDRDVHVRHIDCETGLAWRP